MRVASIARFLLRSRPHLLVRASRTLDEMYRAAFVSALVSEGIAETLRTGPKSLDALHDSLGLEDCRQVLEAWLDVGVSLGELLQPHLLLPAR